MHTTGPTFDELLKSIMVNAAALLRLSEAGVDFYTREDLEAIMEADNTLTDLLDEAESHGE